MNREAESLQRVLEPEVMDTEEEARDYNDMDHSEVNRCFVDDLIEAGLTGGDLLDLGTGTALIPIELCSRNIDCRIMAVDMAAHMLDQAKLNIAANECEEKIQLSQADAKNLGFADGMFDAVISNSIVHHLPEPQLCLAESVRVVKPGGMLFFRDLLRPESDEQVKQLVQTYTGQENQHARQMFEDSLRAALSLAEIRGMIEALGFPSETVQQTTDRHWTWCTSKPGA